MGRLWQYSEGGAAKVTNELDRDMRGKKQQPSRKTSRVDAGARGTGVWGGSGGVRLRWRRPLEACPREVTGSASPQLFWGPWAPALVWGAGRFFAATGPLLTGPSAVAQGLLGSAKALPSPTDARRSLF